MDAFESQKAFHTLLYVVSKLGNPGMHQAFKTIYFAEQAYMADYGMPILEDQYCKMDNGPVPSAIYDFVKVLRNVRDGAYLGELEDQIKTSFKYSHPTLTALVDADTDYLAETELEYLNRSIEFCKNKGFGELKEISHDSAWHDAEMNGRMDKIKIAEAGKASADAIEYLRETFSNNKPYSI